MALRLRQRVQVPVQRLAHCVPTRGTHWAILHHGRKAVELMAATPVDENCRSSATMPQLRLRHTATEDEVRSRGKPQFLKKISGQRHSSQINTHMNQFVEIKIL